jgi:hypothetical protein
VKRLVSACVIVLLAALLAGCVVRPYVPPSATLLTKDGPHKLWRAAEGFIVVSTFQVADPRNEVCVFAMKQDAEEFYAAKLAGENTWTFGCACGPTGRVHPGYTHLDPEVSNQRCERALSEGPE